MQEKGLLMGFDAQFKAEAVHQLLTSGKTREQLARELGVSAWSLSQWKRAALKARDALSRTEEVGKEVTVSAGGKSAKAWPVTNRHAAALDMTLEIRQLREELERVTRQRNLLKKPIAICLQDELSERPQASPPLHSASLSPARGLK